MVIVEYCNCGSVYEFLKRNRENFVNQIIFDKDIIDPTILTKEQRCMRDSGYDLNNR